MLFCRFPDLGRETFAGDRYYDHQRRGLPHILASPFLVLSLLTVELKSLFVFLLYFSLLNCLPRAVRVLVFAVPTQGN